jgi:hypothetical protein
MGVFSNDVHINTCVLSVLISSNILFILFCELAFCDSIILILDIQFVVNSGYSCVSISEICCVHTPNSVILSDLQCGHVVGISY